MDSHKILPAKKFASISAALVPHFVGFSCSRLKCDLQPSEVAGDIVSDQVAKATLFALRLMVNLEDATVPVINHLLGEWAKGQFSRSMSTTFKQQKNVHFNFSLRDG